MKPFISRRFARIICGILQKILPDRLQNWGLAIRNEVIAIPDDFDALLFALESLFGLAPRAIGIQALDAVKDFAQRPRRVAIACAISAVMLGLAYMVIGGAPRAYLGINAGALVFGLLVLAMFSRSRTDQQKWVGAMTFGMALALLATALFGDRVEGAARWVDLGVLFVQPSLVLLPLMIVGFARTSNALSMAGLVVAATALAIQPDRAMAGMLLAGLAALTVFRRDRFTGAALVASIIGFIATLIQSDTLPAVPFVDQIFYTSFDVSFIAGMAVVGGSILIVVPAIIGSAFDSDNRATYSVFGVVWFAAIAAAAFGNYPTPVVGYSGGAVLGYVLSVAMLPKNARLRYKAGQGPEQMPLERGSINQLRRSFAALRIKPRVSPRLA